MKEFGKRYFVKQDLAVDNKPDDLLNRYWQHLTFSDGMDLSGSPEFKNKKTRNMRKTLRYVTKKQKYTWLMLSRPLKL